MSTDPLLDEATRLADRLHDVDPPEVRVLRALVERVQQAEAERDHLRGIATSEVAAHETQVARIAVERDEWHQAALTATAGESRAERERDEARGKLDQVRDWAHHIRTTRQRGDIEYNAASDVLAILDGKTGD